MITQANKYRLWELPSMPYVDLGVNRFLSPLIFEKLQITNADGLTQKIPITVKTLGSIQPMGPQELKVKTEGERAWKWVTIHTATNVDLKDNDRIKVRGTVYKVMAKLDWSRSGYLEFHAIEDFEGGSWE